MRSTNRIIKTFTIVHTDSIHDFCEFQKITCRCTTKFIFTHGDITLSINRLDNSFQTFSCLDRTRTTICLFHLISKRPHDDRRIVLITFYHCSKIKIRPLLTLLSFRMSCILIKEPSIVVSLLATIPSIKSFLLHQKT